MYTTKPYKAYNSLLQTSTIWGTACMACMAYPQIKWLLGRKPLPQETTASQQGLCWSQCWCLVDLGFLLINSMINICATIINHLQSSTSENHWVPQSGGITIAPGRGTPNLASHDKENVGPRHYLGDVGCPRFILKTHLIYELESFTVSTVNQTVSHSFMAFAEPPRNHDASPFCSTHVSPI